ncbi:MAG: amidohydrolase family protein [Alphaproteobacteria bacterium]
MADNPRTLDVGHLLTSPGSEPVQHNACLHIEDGRIAAIFPSPAPLSSSQSGHLAMPALVNAHDHGYGLRPLAFGAADDALEPWITGLAARPPTDPYLEAAVAFARMASGGIATTVHCHNSHYADNLIEEAAAVARAASDVGIRVAFSCPILDANALVYGGPEAIRPLYSPAEWEIVAKWVPNFTPIDDQLARIDAIAATHGNENFNVQLGPIGPQWCRNESLEKIAEASERHNRRIHMHLLESPRQREWSDQYYDGGIVRHLDRIGFLSPRLTVAHGVWLNDEECALLAERGVTVAVNTSANLRLRSGIAPVPAFLKHGTSFALGLDGTTLDDDQDALRDLRLAYLLHGGTGLDRVLTPAALFEAALVNGNAVFDGRRGQGKLTPGGRADILCLDYAAMTRDVVPGTAAELDIILARATARHVSELYVGARPIVTDGILRTVDLSALEHELNSQAAKGAEAIQSGANDRAMHRQHVRNYYRNNGHLASGD